MPGAPTPPTLLEAIASLAGGGFITNPLPETPTGSNAASVQGGFPPVTMTSELAGGLPPLGQDMNGYLFLISAHTLYVECGQTYQFNATLATKIGGYLAGSILGMADGTGLWLCVTNGNMSNPDTGGAGWVPIASYGSANVSGLTGGVVTLSAAQAKKFVVVLSGTLVSNLTIVLPATVQEWLIINNTTGAFSTTVNAGGAGVTAAQGGFSAPTPVYGIGDGNIYLTVAAASLPGYSQTPTSLSLAQRTNTGDLLASYLNTTASPSENPVIGSVAVMSTADDGYIRFSTLTSFFEQAIAQNLSGGVITLPPGNDTRQLRIVWGTVNGGNGVNAARSVPVAFPFSFPNTVIGMIATMIGTGSNDASYAALSVNALTVNGCNLYFRNITTGSINYTAFYMAIGY